MEQIKGKAIYGLAMPFNDAYVEKSHYLSREFLVEKTNRLNKETVLLLDEFVVATLNHNYDRELGIARRNVQLKVMDDGIYFKIVPDSELAMKVYKQVKKGLLRHCSITYWNERKRSYEDEERLCALSQMLGWDDRFKVYEYTGILVSEICLTNNPAHDATFCTTDPNDPRLIGIVWKEVR